MRNRCELLDAQRSRAARRLAVADCSMCRSCEVLDGWPSRVARCTAFASSLTHSGQSLLVSCNRELLNAQRTPAARRAAVASCSVHSSCELLDAQPLRAARRTAVAHCSMNDARWQGRLSRDVRPGAIACVSSARRRGLHVGARRPGAAHSATARPGELPSPWCRAWLPSPVALSCAGRATGQDCRGGVPLGPGLSLMMAGKEETETPVQV